MKTNRRISLGLTAVLILFLASAVFATSGAADYTKVGVKNGDWVSYSYTMSTPTMGTISGTARMDVTQVSGTNVTVAFQATYSGQSATLTYTGDISTGSGGIYAFVIAAGLNAGDPLFMYSPFTINETTSMSFSGVSRTVNRFTTNQYNVSMELCFDRDTGLLLKESLVTSSNSMIIAATSSSAFQADLASVLVLGAIGGVAVLAVLVVGVAYAVSRRRKRAEQVTLVPVTLTSAGPARREEAPRKPSASREAVCPFCGVPLVAGAQFCGSCGTRLME